jgi:alkanesulfonate monooxygenase SsuD/methylene tetrahydromethanopterin reductase-like flavin-dependent oxidoreductase (luciferase family)
MDTAFESIWSWDHFYPLAPPYDGPNLESWTMLAAMAQATTRIRIGAMVNGMHHHHPAVTANMAATIDHISDGRLNLGMGAGWNEMESNAYGLPLGTLRQRSDRFEEGMEVIVSLLSNRETSFDGDVFHLENAWCEPKPIQDHIPIVIGGKGRKRTLRTVARFADQWDMTFPETPDEWTELRGVLDDHCATVGRDAGEISSSIHLGCTPDDDPSELVEAASPFFDAGVDIVVWSWRGPLDLDRLEALATAIREP